MACRSNVISFSVFELTFDPPRVMVITGLLNESYPFVVIFCTAVRNMFLQPTASIPDIPDAYFKFVRQSILSYYGWCVPLRDLQRLRLRSGTSAVVIREAMKSLELDGMGSFRMLQGGLNVFYKCPPELVNSATLLATDEMSANEYKQCFNSAPLSNATNRHSERYWQKIANGSPYVR